MSHSFPDQHFWAEDGSVSEPISDTSREGVVLGKRKRALLDGPKMEGVVHDIAAACHNTSVYPSFHRAEHQYISLTMQVSILSTGNL